MRLFAGGR